jgi:hypothetical protein
MSFVYIYLLLDIISFCFEVMSSYI